MNPEERTEAINEILKDAIDLGKIDANSIKEWSGELGDSATGAPDWTGSELSLDSLI